MTIDQAADQLHRLGWSTGMIRILNRTHGWLGVVEATHCNQVIRARAECAGEAWKKAVKKVNKYRWKREERRNNLPPRRSIY